MLQKSKAYQMDIKSRKFLYMNSSVFLLISVQSPLTSISATYVNPRKRNSSVMILLCTCISCLKTNSAAKTPVT